MRAFKHVPIEYADAFLAGKDISVATYSWYRERENGIRTDKSEGAVFHNTGPIHFKGDAPPDVAAGLAALGVVFENCGEVTITHGVEHTATLKDQFVFCCSLEPDRQFAETHRLFEITDLLGFAHLLAEDHPKVLRNPCVGEVQYEERTGNPIRGEFRSIGPFVKDPALAYEKEIRIVWDTEAQNERRLLECSNAAALIREIAWADVA